jgi:hypothetical protein
MFKTAVLLLAIQSKLIYQRLKIEPKMIALIVALTRCLRK